MRGDDGMGLEAVSSPVKLEENYVPKRAAFSVEGFSQTDQA